MESLILPEVSAGYPSIFFPASEAQQPQKIAAGQHMICMIVRILVSELREPEETYGKKHCYEEPEGRSDDLDMAWVLVFARPLAIMTWPGSVDRTHLCRTEYKQPVVVSSPCWLLRNAVASRVSRGCRRGCSKLLLSRGSVTRRVNGMSVTECAEETSSDL